MSWSHMLMFISTCGIKSSHNDQGNESVKPLRIPKNAFLNVFIDISATFWWFVCYGTSSYTMLLVLIASFYLAGASLSKNFFLGNILFVWKRSMSLWYVPIIPTYVLFFMRSNIISFPYILHRTMMYFLSWCKPTGNFPVLSV